MALHDGEPHVALALVRALVDSQHPVWSTQPLTALPATGTDHWLFRLGEDLVVRVPRIDWAVGQADLERRWLPVLEPHLPVAVPACLAVGEPALGYPWPWSVYRWIPGRTPDRGSAHDRRVVAVGLGGFCAALRQVPMVDAAPRADQDARGAPLVARDAATRDAIAAVSDELDPRELQAAWDAALAVPAYDGPGAWLHGDLLAGNLLVGPPGDGEALVAVIDWGPLAVGDPAADAAAAWGFLSADTRAQFRESSAYDDGTWARGRGWALTTALGALPYYRSTSPRIADTARRTIAEVLGDR